VPIVTYKITEDHKHQPRIEWGPMLSPDFEIPRASRPDEVDIDDAASQLLIGLLGGGDTISQADIMERAYANGIHGRTIYRTAKKLGVIKKQSGKGLSHTSKWSFPSNSPYLTKGEKECDS
jgi:hypothetical protein